MRSSFRKRSFKRRKAPFRKRTFRRSRPFKRSFKRKGFVKGYKKAGFVGRKNPSFRKIFKSSGVRRVTNWNIIPAGGNPMVNVNTIGRDNAFVMMPLGAITQTDSFGTDISAAGPTLFTDTFSTNKFWLTGINLDLFFIAASSQDYFIRILCFWVTDDQALYTVVGGTNTVLQSFVNTASLANTPAAAAVKNNNATVRFLDLPYVNAAGYPNSANITTRANPNYPGKLLFDIKKKLTCTSISAASGGNPSHHFVKYFPFNKLYEVSTYPFLQSGADGADPDTTDQLTVAPNFGKHGQPVFVIYFFNTEDVVAPESNLYVNGNMTTYFHDMM
nr:MAG: capsid protein [Cressdnaviricota sp.]